jgi:hypothetical protein
MLSLHNDGLGLKGIELQPHSIEAFGESFPIFTRLTVPVEVATSDSVSLRCASISFYSLYHRRRNPIVDIQ